MTHTFTAKVGSDKYPIIIGVDISQEILAFIKTYPERSVFIICDSYFKDLNCQYSKKLELIKKFNHIFIEGGVESKSISSYENVLKVLSDNKIAKDGLIVAIGGGVTGDLAAFIASTYQRGIDLIHIPTTTTAMIDSSVGGKTGLNCLDQVNLIGSYYNPKAIFMDLEFLTTLNNRDYYSGICEAIKMSITSDSEMFHRFFNIRQNLIDKEYEFLDEVIYWSVITKLKHVCDDAREKSIRLILNYGHTFGQAIESYYGLYQDTLRHGEAIALGITTAAKLSTLIYKTSKAKDLYLKTKEILTNYYLPTDFESLNTNNIPLISKLLENLINDKKRISKGNRFIICESPGEANIELIDDHDLLSQSFNTLYK